MRSDEDLRAFVDGAEIFSGRFGNGVDGDQSSIGRGPWARFDFLPIGAASGLEPIDWLIDGYVEAGSLVVLYGPSGSTKTFIALHMGLSIATGSPFFGQAGARAPCSTSPPKVDAGSVGGTRRGASRMAPRWASASASRFSAPPPPAA